jgi:hypothetical protein
MADFGRTDEFAPNSSLLSDSNNSTEVRIEDGRLINIWKNDWLDVSELALPADPYWGYSFQVSKIEGSTIFVKAYNLKDDIYCQTALSPEYISNVYRLVGEI